MAKPRAKPAKPPPKRPQPPPKRKPAPPPPTPVVRRPAHPPRQPAPPVVAHPAGGIHSGTPAQLSLWGDQLFNACNYAHIPVEIEWGVFGLETQFGTYVGTSSTGAMGLVQFEPATAAQYHYPMTDYPDQSQSQAQFTAGALYLRDLYKQHGNWDSALQHYSGGGYGLAQVQAKANSKAMPGSSGPGNLPGRIKYVNPLGAAQVTPERIDQGVDFSVQGGKLLAIADGVIRQASSNFPGWPGGIVIQEVQNGGPMDGLLIGCAEGVTPTVSIGQHVHAGDTIANLRAGWYTGIEYLLFDTYTGGVPWAANHGGFDGTHSTAAGEGMATILHALGAPQGILVQPVRGQQFPNLSAIISDITHNPIVPNPLTLNTVIGTGAYSYLVPLVDSSDDIGAAFSQLDGDAKRAYNDTQAMKAFINSTHYVTVRGRR